LVDRHANRNAERILQAIWIRVNTELVKIMQWRQPVVVIDLGRQGFPGFKCAGLCIKSYKPVPGPQGYLPVSSKNNVIISDYY
jgi:hypothetical protein